MTLSDFIIILVSVILILICIMYCIYALQDKDSSEQDPHLNLRSSIQHIDVLRGPISGSQHFSAKYGKMVYIFGDRHEYSKVKSRSIVDEYHSVSVIDEFIYNTVEQNRNKVIDIYLEHNVEYDDIDLCPDQGYLFNNMIETWGSCLVSNKNQCPSNVRFHGIDVRRNGTPIISQVESLCSNIGRIQKCFNKAKRHIIDVKDEEYIKTQLLIIRKTMKTYTSKFPLDEMIKEAGILDQLNSIPDIELQHQIKDYFLIRGFYPEALKPQDFIELDHKLTTIIPKSQSSAQNLRSEDDKLRILDAYMYVLDFKLKFVNWMCWLMDAYLITKMFCSAPKFIIIYTGNYHAEIYRHFLTHILKFEILAHTGRHDNQHLNIQSWHQPLFQDAHSMSLA